MKTIKSIFPVVMLAFLITYTVPVMSQENKDKPDKEGMEKHRKEMAEKIKASKIAFITEQVSLSPEEAEKFWPVYNEMEQKREESTRKIMERYRKNEERPEITDEKALEMMDARFKQEQDLLELKTTYHQKFLNILSPVKVLKLYEAEDRFRRQLMERVDHRREGERNAEGRGVAKPHNRSGIRSR